MALAAMVLVGPAGCTKPDREASAEAAARAQHSAGLLFDSDFEPLAQATLAPIAAEAAPTLRAMLIERCRGRDPRPPLCLNGHIGDIQVVETSGHTVHVSFLTTSSDEALPPAAKRSSYAVLCRVAPGVPWHCEPDPWLAPSGPDADAVPAFSVYFAKLLQARLGALSSLPAAPDDSLDCLEPGKLLRRRCILPREKACELHVAAPSDGAPVSASAMLDVTVNPIVVAHAALVPSVHLILDWSDERACWQHGLINGRLEVLVDGQLVGHVTPGYDKRYTFDVSTAAQPTASASGLSWRVKVRFNDGMGDHYFVNSVPNFCVFRVRELGLGLDPKRARSALATLGSVAEAQQRVADALAASLVLRRDLQATAKTATALVADALQRVGGWPESAEQEASVRAVVGDLVLLLGRQGLLPATMSPSDGWAWAQAHRSEIAAASTVPVPLCDHIFDEDTQVLCDKLRDAARALEQTQATGRQMITTYDSGDVHAGPPWLRFLSPFTATPSDAT